MRRQETNKANETAQIKRYSEKQWTSTERMRRQEKNNARLQVKHNKNRYASKKEKGICEAQHHCKNKNSPGASSFDSELSMKYERKSDS